MAGQVTVQCQGCISIFNEIHFEFKTVKIQRLQIGNIEKILYTSRLEN